MNKFAIPSILAAITIVAGIFAFVPIDQATSVHTTNTMTLAADSVTATAIGTDAIDADAIAASAIGAAEIAAAAITSTTIATDAIGAAEIATAAITSTEFADDAIGASEIAASAIDADAIGAGAITATTIDAGAISSDEIAASAIGAAEIAANAIGESELAGVVEPLTNIVTEFDSDIAAADKVVLCSGGTGDGLVQYFAVFGAGEDTLTIDPGTDGAGGGPQIVITFSTVAGGATAHGANTISGTLGLDGTSITFSAGTATTDVILTVQCAAGDTATIRL